MCWSAFSSEVRSLFIVSILLGFCCLLAPSYVTLHILTILSFVFILYPVLSFSFSSRICKSFPSSFSLCPNQVSPGSLLLTASEMDFDCATEFFGLGLGFSSSSSSSVSHSLYHPMASLAQAGFPFCLSSPTLQKPCLFRSFLVCPTSSVTCCPWLLSCPSSRHFEYL